MVVVVGRREKRIRVDGYHVMRIWSWRTSTTTYQSADSPIFRAIQVSAVRDFIKGMFKDSCSSDYGPCPPPCLSLIDEPLCCFRIKPTEGIDRTS